MLKWLRSKNLPVGEKGESIAAKYLRSKGYKILGRNVKLGPYEIDIIVLKGDTTAFVEVKTRADDYFASPEESVDHKKREHIRRAARHYISRQDDPDMFYRFDVVAVVARENAAPQVTVYYDAFRDE